MEKIFSPNKFFLSFCILFIVVWLGLQVVSYMHLTNQAKLDGERIFNWNWPSKNMHSTAEIYETKILSRSSNDATVKVLAREHIDKVGSGRSEPHPYENVADPESGRMQSAPTNCAALLTYYRMNNKWFLGKVEFE
jgi:hypothetical protein